MAFYVSKSPAFSYCWQWWCIVYIVYHQISEAVASKDEETDPEEWSARSWWHHWCTPACTRALGFGVPAGVLLHYCTGVLVFSGVRWCHRYSNSTPATPPLPFIFNLWHAAVQLFELIASEAASVTEATPLDLFKIRDSLFKIPSIRL